MATLPIDFSLLEKDELEEELLVRSIIECGTDAFRALNDFVTQERSGARVQPLPLPTVRLESELNACRAKYDALLSAAQNARTSGNDVADSALLIRFWHLESKVNRLLSAYPGSVSVSTLQKIIQAQVQQLVNEVDQVNQGASNANTSALAQRSFHGFSTPLNPLDKFIRSNLSGNRNAVRSGLSNAGVFSNQSRHTPVDDRFSGSNLPVHDFPTAQVPQQQQQPQQRQPQQQQQHAIDLRGNVQGFPHRYNLGHAMSRWPIRYPGPSKIPIDEFIFRVENLAAADNIPLPSLMLGLHFLLEKGPSDFFWNYLRKNPAAAWNDFRAALLERYATLDTDVEIRKAIADRRQLTGEAFGEFSLSIENLTNRLRRPMDEGEIIEYLRQNMSHRLQTALLLHPTYTIRELQAHCRRFEKLWEVQSLSARRPVGRVQELEDSFDHLQIRHPPQPVIHSSIGNQLAVYAPETMNVDYASAGAVEAFRQRATPIQAQPGPNRAEYLICWNCSDIGHTFTDCVAARTVFCYGCGEKNTYKPQCTTCNSGNANRGGVIARSGRPNPFSLPRKEDQLNKPQ